MNRNNEVPPDFLSRQIDRSRLDSQREVLMLPLKAFEGGHNLPS